MSDSQARCAFPPHLLPLCTLRRTPPPISLLSRFKTLCVLLRAFKACFLIPACKCNRAEVCRCTFGLYAESPRSARLSRSNGNNLLKSNPFGHDKAPRWKPWVTESFAEMSWRKGAWEATLTLIFGDSSRKDPVTLVQLVPALNP